MRNNNMIDRIATGRATVLLTLLAIIGLVATRGIFFPNSIPVKENWGLFSTIFEAWKANSTLFWILDGGFVVMFAFMFNQADTRFNIIRVRTSLPFFMAGMILATSSFILGNIAEGLSTLFIILAISSLFTSYQQHRAEKQAFDIALFLSLASMLWLKTILLLPVFWMGMYMMKTFNLRSFAASLIGIITPYWFAFFYFAYIQDYTPLLNHFTSMIDFHLIDITVTPIYTWIHLGITLMATLFSIGHTIFSSFTDKIRTRSYLNFLFIVLLSSYILFIIDFGNSGAALYLIYLISAFLISHLFASVRGRFSSILFHTLFFTYILIYLWSLS
ncbi:MAG: hypothetical protein PHV20_12590 [Bacteroidales bacterium]|nr:hypothetical protein [Bacteroidales bacterium]